MANQYAGRWSDALFAANSKLVKNALFSIYTDAACTTPATTYTDRSMSAVASIHSSDATGMAEIFAAPGTYWIRTDLDSLPREIQVKEDIADTVDHGELAAAIQASSNLGVSTSTVNGRVAVSITSHFAITNGHGVYYDDPTQTPSDRAAYFDIVTRSLIPVGEL